MICTVLQWGSTQWSLCSLNTNILKVMMMMMMVIRENKLCQQDHVELNLNIIQRREPHSQTGFLLQQRLYFHFCVSEKKDKKYFPTELLKHRNVTGFDCDTVTLIEIKTIRSCQENRNIINVRPTCLSSSSRPVPAYFLFELSPWKDRAEQIILRAQMWLQWPSKIRSLVNGRVSESFTTGF